MSSHTRTGAVPAAVRRAVGLRRTASALALLAGSLGLVALSSPARAQCVEGPPNSFTCAGQTVDPQVIVGDDVSAATTAGFAVDTSANGNGLALSMTGDGRITYTDLQASSLTGAGVWFNSTGASGQDSGSVVVFSDGAIAADGAYGLRIDNDGTGDTTAFWSGSILNAGGSGVFLRTGPGSGDASLTVADVRGRDDGVRIDNNGVGSTQVVATGTVTGLGERGIVIDSGANTTGVMVEANSVVGGSSGIAVMHHGSGGVSVTAAGAVSGGTGTGIYVEGEAAMTDISVRAAGVSGGYVGIRTINDGVGSTFISASGPVTGGSQGVLAEAGSAATDMTIEVGDVTGDLAGIEVINYGAGWTRLRSTGVVAGGAWDGISVETGTGSEGVVIEVVDVHGDQDGVFLLNQGTGPSVVTATGEISAKFGSGVEVVNGLSTTEIEINVAAVSGGDRGVSASSEGAGGVYITATGPVSGEDFGVIAEAGAASSNIHIRAVDVFSDRNGVVAQNDGTGFTWITSTGTVVGTDEAGIRAFAGTNSFSIVIDANNASGGVSGISAVSFGLGPVEITTRGLVQGGDQGIDAFSAVNGVSIVNEGTVRNASGLSSDRAITAGGGGVSLFNNGLLVGEISVTAGASVIANYGVWNSIGGTSTFAGADDGMFNMEDAGILAGLVAGAAETTTWSGLEVFTNRGLLRLADGGTGDAIETSADTVFEDTALLAVDIGGANGSDVFRTSGSVEIEAGSRLVLNSAQPLVLHGKYVVVEAAGGLTGQFDFEDQFLTAFAGLRDGYTATSAFVEFAQLRALAEAGITPNQKAAAAGADSLPDGNAVKDVLLLLPDDAAAVDAFDQLSGEIHPSARTAMIEDGRLPRNAVLDRLADGEQGGAVWGRAYGDDGVSDGDLNAARVERDARGVLFGVDRTFGAVTLGVAAGWSDTDLEIARRDSDGSIESVHGLVYAGARFGGWGVRGGLGYAKTSIETERRIAFPGFAAAPTADHDGAVAQGFVEAGYRMPLGGGHVEPFANLTVARAETDAFTETGGPAALAVEEAAETSTTSTLGLRFETRRQGAFSMRGEAGWRHGFGDLDPVNQHAFDGGAPFTILGAARSRDAAAARVETRWRLSSRASVGVAYDGVLGTDGQDHAITGGLKVVF